ncbi:hypothetical protein Tco_1300996 [Tanacetum coccineum]
MTSRKVLGYQHLVMECVDQLRRVLASLVVQRQSRMCNVSMRAKTRGFSMYMELGIRKYIWHCRTRAISIRTQKYIHWISKLGNMKRSALDYWDLNTITGGIIIHVCMTIHQTLLRHWIKRSERKIVRRLGGT